MADHNHSCGQEHHEHDHSDAERGLEFNLYLKIDSANVECLNETVEGSGKDVFKPWDNRLDTEKFVESDADEELLFNIPPAAPGSAKDPYKTVWIKILSPGSPEIVERIASFDQGGNKYNVIQDFTGNVKLKGIIVIGGEGDTHPSRMKLYKNRPGMTFDDTGAEADQEFELHQDNDGQLEYATKIVKFSSVQHLSIYFPKNFGADTTIVYYIGLRGEFTEAKRHEVTICTYEARANPSDHKTNTFDSVHQQIQ